MTTVLHDGFVFAAFSVNDFIDDGYKKAQFAANVWLFAQILSHLALLSSPNFSTARTDANVGFATDVKAEIVVIRSVLLH